MIYMTFLGGVLGLLYKKKNRKQAQNTPRKSEKNYRATTKGQNRFGTFPHFSTLLHTFQNFSPGLLLKLRPFKENKKKKTKPFCTLVVARLSSSKKSHIDHILGGHRLDE